MKPSLDPQRLANRAGDGAIDLGAAIRTLRARGANASEIESLARRMASHVSAPAGVAASRVAVGAGAKWIATVLIAAAIGWYALVQHGRVGSVPLRPDAVASTPLRAREPAQQATAAVPSAAATAAPAPASEVALDHQATAAEKRAPARVLPRAALSPSRSGAAPDAELALLERAQAALDHEPAGALALAEQHARIYPRGLFAQEREILAIEALLKLRRRQEAVARAMQFVQRYPDSAHARRVRSLLERSSLAPRPANTPASDHSSTESQR